MNEKAPSQKRDELEAFFIDLGFVEVASFRIEPGSEAFERLYYESVSYVRTVTIREPGDPYIRIWGLPKENERRADHIEPPSAPPVDPDDRETRLGFEESPSGARRLGSYEPKPEEAHAEAVETLEPPAPTVPWNAIPEPPTDDDPVVDARTEPPPTGFDSNIPDLGIDAAVERSDSEAPPEEGETNEPFPLSRPPSRPPPMDDTGSPQGNETVPVLKHVSSIPPPLPRRSEPPPLPHASSGGERVQNDEAPPESSVPISVTEEELVFDNGLPSVRS